VEKANTAVARVIGFFGAIRATDGKRTVSELRELLQRKP